MAERILHIDTLDQLCVGVVTEMDILDEGNGFPRWIKAVEFDSATGKPTRMTFLNESAIRVRTQTSSPGTYNRALLRSLQSGQVSR